MVDKHALWGVLTALALFALIAAGPNALDWVYQVKNKGVYDVREYGATCNGTTDDSTAIQSAVNAAQSAGGGRVVFPSGKQCVIAHPVVVTGSGVAIDGGALGQLYGSGARIKVTVGAGENAFLFQGDNSNNFVVNHNSLQNLQFDGTTAQSVMDYAVKVYRQQAFYLHNVSFYNVGSGYLFDYCMFCYVNRVDILGLKAGTGIGMGFSGYPGISWVSDFFINGNNYPCGYNCDPNYGIVVSATGGLHLRDGDIEHTRTCMAFLPGENQIIEFGEVTSVYCDSNSSRGVVLQPQHATAVIHGMDFQNNWSSSSGGPGYVLDGTVGTVDGVGIHSGRIVNNFGNGIDVVGSGVSNWSVDSDVHITKNVSQKSGTVTTNGVNVTWASGSVFAPMMAQNTITINGVPYTVDAYDPSTGNITLTTSAGIQSSPVPYTYGMAAGCGIHIAAGVSKGRIRGNTIGVTDYLDAGITGEVMNTQTFGICVDAGASDYLEIANNTLINNVSAGLASSATGTHNLIVDNVGYNPVGASGITPGASPYTFTAGPTPTTVYIFGGTVSVVKRGAAEVCSSSPCMVHLPPNQSVTVTYSVAPTMTKDVH